MLKCSTSLVVRPFSHMPPMYSTPVEQGMAQWPGGRTQLMYC